MYKIYTNLKTLSLAVAGSLALTLSSPLLAGPGKPGNNGILPGGNIVEIAIAANEVLGVFDTLLAAAQCEYFDGAVVALLTGEDKVTLFAPTDDAFAELGLNAHNVCETFDGSLDALGGPELLLTILAYHVTDGRRFSNSLFNRNNSKPVEMLAGGYIWTTPDLLISDNAGQEVGLFLPYININATNGVIHVIDTVLLPIEL